MEEFEAKFRDAEDGVTEFNALDLYIALWKAFERCRRAVSTLSLSRQ